MSYFGAQHTIPRSAGGRRANDSALDVCQLHLLSTLNGAAIPSMAHDAESRCAHYRKAAALPSWDRDRLRSISGSPGLGMTLVLLVAGLIDWGRAEKTFADTI